MTGDNETKLVAVDGTDALAMVIVRPGSGSGSVSVEAAAKRVGVGVPDHGVGSPMESANVDPPHGRIGPCRSRAIEASKSGRTAGILQTGHRLIPRVPGNSSRTGR